MSNNLALTPALSGSWLATREQRKAGREIIRVRIRSAVAVAREVSKVEAIAEVAESALLATSEVSALEATLISRTPHAETRLQHVGDSASAAMSNVVLQAGRRL